MLAAKPEALGCQQAGPLAVQVSAGSLERPPVAIICRDVHVDVHLLNVEAVFDRGRATKSTELGG